MGAGAAGAGNLEGPGDSAIQRKSWDGRGLAVPLHVLFNHCADLGNCS
jgi:hypothetical protein